MKTEKEFIEKKKIDLGNFISLINFVDPGVSKLIIIDSFESEKSVPVVDPSLEESKSLLKAKYQGEQVLYKKEKNDNRQGCTSISIDSDLISEKMLSDIFESHLKVPSDMSLWEKGIIMYIANKENKSFLEVKEEIRNLSLKDLGI